jgi:hypothetical protein
VTPASTFFVSHCVTREAHSTFILTFVNTLSQSFFKKFLRQKMVQLFTLK